MALYLVSAKEAATTSWLIEYPPAEAEMESSFVRDRVRSGSRNDLCTLNVHAYFFPWKNSAVEYPLIDPPWAEFVFLSNTPAKDSSAQQILSSHRAGSCNY